jgi:NAD(P)-dependent dehydrogenase (short-subunit alcohol dehydrogenase family)
LIETRNPARPLGDPSDLVGTAVFLATMESDFMIGQTLNVDGGTFFS